MRFLAPGLLLLLIPLQAVAARLAIIKFTLHQYEDGPPVYADQRYIPGETVFMSFQVEGYEAAKSGEQRKVHLRYRMEAIDSEKLELVPPATGEVKTELSPQDKEWLPKVRWSFVIPPHAWAGTYHIDASVKDELSGQEATAQVAFNVRGRHVEPSDTLVVRNFEFLRNEGDTHPLMDPSYRPGQRLWARFDITGFKIGEKNHIWVEYGISILNAAGKLLYSQPEGATEQDSPFYPKRSVPGIVSLVIQPGTPAAEYTLRLMVRDMVGGQTDESSHVFRIE